VSVSLRPRARLDLLEQFVYFDEHADVSLAERYHVAVDATFAHLADHPKSGSLYDCGIAGLKGLRRFLVKGFDNYLIFYLPQKNGIHVIRILHGARDIDRLLADEEPA
jgi:toxin ParE1/3/4